MFLGSLVPVVFFVLLVRKKVLWSDICQLYATVQRTTDDSHYHIQQLPCYQDPVLLARLWKLPSAKPYLAQHALEFQRREGYCSCATLRCMLKSIPSFPRVRVPAEHGGESNPDKWVKNLQQDCLAAVVASDDADDEQQTNNQQQMENTASEQTTNTTMPPLHVEIVAGDVSYADFLSALRRGLLQQDNNNYGNDDNNNNKKCYSRRVAVNYLRPALVGFKAPRWVPMNLALGIAGGHFSPVIGILEDHEDDDASTSTSLSSSSSSLSSNTNTHTNRTKQRASAPDKDNILVGVFDVNHTYGGAYLVPARRLYESVKAMDISVSKPRATIILSVEE